MQFGRIILIGATAVWIAGLGTLAGQDQNPSSTPPDREIGNVGSAERKAEKSGPADKRREDKAKRLEELKNLSPEEREAKLKEWRAKKGGDPDKNEPKLPTAEQKEARKKEWREKMEGALKGLREKKAKGTLTEEESRKLSKMEEWLRRLDIERPKEVAPPPGK